MNMPTTQLIQIYGGSLKLSFFDIWSGFCVKSVQTDRHTDTFPLYIYRYIKKIPIDISRCKNYC